MTDNTTLNVKYIETTKIKPYERNARIHVDNHIDEIVTSINTFKFTNPLLIDENYIILAGHGRWLAAKKLNLEKVPCIQIDYLNEAQKKAYRIADNKLTINGALDDNLLGLEFKDLSELNLDFNLDVTGFSIPEIDFTIFFYVSM